MINLLAATDPTTGIYDYFFTQGVLGILCICLIAVVIYQTKKLDKKDETHAAEIKALNAQLFAESKQHASDYREMSKDNQEVLQSNSQANQLLVAKIEAVKGRR